MNSKPHEMTESIAPKALERDTTDGAGVSDSTTAPPAVETPRRGAGQFARNVGLFAAAPFIGLAYLIAMPFVFFGMTAKLATEALRNRKSSS